MSQGLWHGRYIDISDYGPCPETADGIHHLTEMSGWGRPTGFLYCEADECYLEFIVNVPDDMAEETDHPRPHEGYMPMPTTDGRWLLDDGSVVSNLPEWRWG